MRVRRREFLQFAGFTVAGLTLGRLGRDRLLAHETFRESWGRGPGVEQRVRSVCGQCAAGCGLEVRLVDGRPVHLEGNPLCPQSRGALCAKGAAGLQAWGDPDRLVGPVRRSGQRGAGRWERIGWEEAVQQVAAHLDALRRGGRPHGLVCLTGRQGGMTGQLLRRFCQAYGSPNVVQIPEPYEDTSALVAWATQGVAAPLGYDLERTNYLLSFGSPILESWRSPVWASRAYGRLRRGRPEHRGRFVQVESRLSPTASRADEWIPVRPGAEAAVALGIAHVMVREGLYDEDFVRERTFGFEDWTDGDGHPHLGFRRLVLDEYDPETVAAITGVPGVTIRRLARQFAAAEAALAIGEGGDFQAQFAAHCLNALAGSVGVPGGAVVQQAPPLQPLPPVGCDEQARMGLSHPRVANPPGSPMPQTGDSLPALAEAILEGTAYPVEALWLDGTASWRACPAWERLEQAVATVPFVVSFSPYLDEKSALADLVLPDHTPLEKWQDVAAAPWAGPPAMGISQPAVAPLLDTRHTGEAILAIARQLGGAIGTAFPWQGYQEVLQHGARGLYEARRGTVYATPYESAWIGQLEQGGWWVPSAASFEEFWTQLLERGGWWDPAPLHGPGEPRFESPSGRFEFYSQNLQHAQAGREDRACLPHHQPTQWTGEEADYPLLLNPFEVLALSGLRDLNQPFLLETMAPHLQERWNTWVEINPQTARASGICEGDWVWVESPLGKVQARARLYAGAMPEVASLPVGLGMPAGGRWVQGRGANPGRILAPAHDPVAGTPRRWTTRVRLTKVSPAS
ncbi:MAG: molybdopterin-dependent oxidoreductase [Candidatus Latescibacterota bacterium]